MDLGFVLACSEVRENRCECVREPSRTSFTGTKRIRDIPMERDQRGSVASEPQSWPCALTIVGKPKSAVRLA